MLVSYHVRRCAQFGTFTLLVALAASSAFAQSDGLVIREFEDDGQFLDEIENQRHITTQAIQTQVARQLNMARQMFDTQPDAAIADLKSMLEQVEAAPDLPAEVRIQIRNQVVTAIKEGRRREREFTERQQLTAARRAQGKERQRMLESSFRIEEKLDQIIARYNHLLDEWRFREAEQAATSARQMEPYEPMLTSAVLTSRTTGYNHDMMQVRETRQKGVVDALFATERAHVPVADEPPIVYPDAQVWEELTLRRRKYAAMSLERQGSAEEQIFDALQQPTTLEFIETPLSDVVDYLKDLHDIEIQIEYRALEEVGMGPITPVSRNLKGISLRSALKLMLRELDLTYTVRDEVLLITTPERVAAELTAKVYPVADLVLPISNNVGTNPFQMGAGLGGQGAFGGGMNQGGMNNQMPGGNFGDLFNNPGGPLF